MTPFRAHLLPFHIRVELAGKEYLSVREWRIRISTSLHHSYLHKLLSTVNVGLARVSLTTHRPTHLTHLHSLYHHPYPPLHTLLFRV